MKWKYVISPVSINKITIVDIHVNNIQTFPKIGLHIWRYIYVHIIENRNLFTCVNYGKGELKEKYYACSFEKPTEYMA